MGYKIYINKLENEGQEIQDYVKSNFQYELDEIERLKKELIWCGPGKRSFMNEFDKLINNLNLIKNMIEGYGKIMVEVSNEFGTSHKKISSDWEETKNNMKSAIGNKLANSVMPILNDNTIENSENIIAEDELNDILL